MSRNKSSRILNTAAPTFLAPTRLSLSRLACICRMSAWLEMFKQHFGKPEGAQQSKNLTEKVKLELSTGPPAFGAPRQLSHSPSLCLQSFHGQGSLADFESGESFRGKISSILDSLEQTPRSSHRWKSHLQTIHTQIPAKL